MKQNKKEDLFFRERQDGQKLFYPWGYPGEAFCLNQKQNRNLTIFFYSMAIIFALLVGVMIFLLIFDLVHASFSDFIIITAFMTITVIYLLTVLILQRLLSVSLYSEKTKIKKRTTRAWVLLFFPFLLTWNGISSNNTDFALSCYTLFFSVSYAVIFIFLIIKINKTKGYIFTK